METNWPAELPTFGKGSAVEVAGTTSWRFAESAPDDLPHLALFVRDAVGLPVVPGAAVPPRLAGPVHDHRDLLSEQERQDAGRQWAGWWEAVMAPEVPPLQSPGPERSSFPELRTRRERAGCPPDFAALADRPALHRAVVETFLEGYRWVGRRQRDSPGERGGCFAYRLVRQVAEAVAVDHSVNIGDVRASAIVLDVEGSWWHLLAPGTVACSLATTAQPDTAELLLRQAFESGLRPQLQR